MNYKIFLNNFLNNIYRYLTANEDQKYILQK